MYLRSAIALVLVTALCVPAARAQGQPDLWHSFAERLPPGALVVVRLSNGSTVQGQIVQVTSESMTILPKKRLPVPARALAFTDVESMERLKEGMSPGAKVLASVGAAGGIVLLVVVSMVASGHWD
jgi:hypothetical protein